MLQVYLICMIKRRHWLLFFWPSRAEKKTKKVYNITVYVNDSFLNHIQVNQTEQAIKFLK